MKKIVVVDYNLGNVRSFQNALYRLGVAPILSNDSEEILKADGVILPGVGAFQTGMNNLNKFNLPAIIKDYLVTGKPFLGVCLGMQLLFDESEEFGHNRGLGLIKGKVTLLKINKNIINRLPHIGWRNVELSATGKSSASILKYMKPEDKVYFVHSYVGEPDFDEDSAAYASYAGSSFCAAVKKDNIMGTQFHPEKSGEVGLNILKQFIKG